MALVLGVLVIVVTVTVLFARRLRDRADDLRLDPADIAELRAIAARVLLQNANAPAAGVPAQVTRILARGVPARGLQPSERPGRWYLTFADGSSLLVAPHRVRDIMILGTDLARGAAQLSGYAFEGDDLLLSFTGAGRPEDVLQVVMA